MKKNRINITELLKECPQGMELDCTIFKKPVKYMGLASCGTYIIIKTSCGEVFYLTKEGYLHDMADSKCIIFPKGKTSWIGFVPPCKFKDGDVVACDAEKGVQLFIFKEYIYNHDCVKCYMMLDCGGEMDFEIGDYYVERFATEEEKRKLFKAINDNGYRWNTETKELEELVTPYFKVGDRIRHKNNKTLIRTIDYIYYDSYALCDGHLLFFKEQDNYELVPSKFDINTLVPFDSRVLVRDSNGDRWKISFWGYLIDNTQYGYKYDTARGCYKQCIPYEGNEHLLGKTDNCIDFYKTW